MTNYQSEMQKILNSLSQQPQKNQRQKPKLLLHCCCAPCATHVLNILSDKFDITAFFYNPNIFPFYEYEKRLVELQKLCEAHHPDVKIIAPEYNSEEFLAVSSGLEDEPEHGRRCNACISLRLEKTAKFSKQNGYDYFCSTLSISPHKDCLVINETGALLEQRLGVLWLFNDFKKQDGFRASTELSKKYGIYRQNYCGCEFSIRKEGIDD